MQAGTAQASLFARSRMISQWPCLLPRPLLSLSFALPFSLLLYIQAFKPIKELSGQLSIQRPDCQPPNHILIFTHSLYIFFPLILEQTKKPWVLSGFLCIIKVTHLSFLFFCEEAQSSSIFLLLYSFTHSFTQPTNHLLYIICWAQDQPLEAIQ